MKTEINKEILKANNITEKAETPYMAIACMVIALPIFIYANTLEADSDGIMPLLLTGFVFMVVGVIRLFNNGKGYITTDTNEKLNEATLFFDNSQRAEVEETLRNGEFTKLHNIACKNGNQALMLELYCTKNNSTAIYRLYKYVPYSYEPAGEIGFYHKKQ